ncbi:MAG: DUF3050 domain-containing protein [Bernardetiaceae bacterium]|nr:DUF3050 domain-containing protein [Bernardetiaceae bacterium]
MSLALSTLETRIAPLRQSLLAHQVYQAIESPEALRIFMSHHVFAVWDFMSLLKALQRELTCVTLPWRPNANAATARLINEIVCGEESDLDLKGNAASHFELYLQAMQQADTHTQPIIDFLQQLDSTPIKKVVDNADIPETVRQFLSFTFKIIAENKPHVLAAVFTFGREDLIPDMFRKIVEDLKKHFPDKLNALIYYLDRHIELDEDTHTPLAREMTKHLCAEDPIKIAEAADAVEQALRMRIKLWDGVWEAIQETKLVVTE